MQEIKNCINSLALMNKPVDFDDLSILILNRLDPAVVPTRSTGGRDSLLIKKSELIFEL